MNSSVIAVILALSSGLVLACGGAGSGTDDTGSQSDQPLGLFIQGNATQRAPTCEVSSEPTAPLRGAGVLDVGLKLDYEASLLVGSELNVIPVVEGARIQLLTDTGALVTSFEVPASGAMSPDPSGSGGHGIITVTLVPPTIGTQLAGELSRGEARAQAVEATVFGTTIDGASIESAPFHYLVKVCLGCLIDYPPATLQNNTCTRQLDETLERPCRQGQDDFVDCRRCAATNGLCLTPE